MTNAEQLYGDFVDAWNAGRRPQVDEYLGRAHEAERGELTSLLDAWLQIAPTPDYDEATLAEIRAEPILQAAIAEAEQQATPLAERVRALREKAGLSLAAFAAAVADRVSVPADDRLSGYLTQLETGELDERRLSQRLLDALASALSVRPTSLVPSPAAGQAFFRADDDADLAISDSLDTLSQAAFAEAPGDQMDELDRLFRGGPGA